MESQHNDNRLITLGGSSVNKRERKGEKPKMTDKQEPSDGMHWVEQQLQATSTSDPNLNLNDQSASDPSMSKVKNSPSMNSTKEGKKKGFAPEDLKCLLNDVRNKPNIPERILFVVDTVKEKQCSEYKTKGESFLPLNMTRRIIEIFLKIKLGIQSKHKFALMTLNSEGVTWICDFTNDCQMLLDCLNMIEYEQQEDEQNVNNLGTCFEKISEEVEIDDNQCFPNYIVRTILIYGRSMEVPILISGQEQFESLMKNKNFFLDILYMHEQLNSSTNCHEIYKNLCALDINKNSFILEVGRDLASLHVNMAKLLAHPFQRVHPIMLANEYNQKEVHTNV